MPQVEVAVGLLVMCDEFRGHSQSGPRTIEVFPNSASARHDVEPPWPMEDQYFIDPGTADVWVELPIRYSHPVKAVPVGAVASSVGVWEAFPFALRTIRGRVAARAQIRDLRVGREIRKGGAGC